MTLTGQTYPYVVCVIYRRGDISLTVAIFQIGFKVGAKLYFNIYIILINNDNFTNPWLF
jgi:hypothetical protein